AVETWYPNYGFGNGAWHTLGIGIRAEAAGQAAFTNSRAVQLEAEHLSYVAGPTVQVLANQLNASKAESYIPYAPTMRNFVSALEIAERWNNLSDWYADKGHFWVGSGPLYLEAAYPVEKIA